MRCLIFILASLWVETISISGACQTTSEDAEEAERLFNVGIADMEAGKYATGCPSLAQSQQLVPNHGTLAAWADCEDHAGHFATAFNLYGQYLQNFASMNDAQKKRHASRAAEAEVRRKELQSLVPSLRIILPHFTPKNAKVLLNGSELTLGKLNFEMPLDPGEHFVALLLTDGSSTAKKVTLKPGDHIRLELESPPPPFTEELLEPPRSSPSRSAEPQLPTRQKPIPPVEKEPAPSQRTRVSTADPSLGKPVPFPAPPEERNWRRTFGFVSFGTGITGFGAGAVIGIITSHQHDPTKDGNVLVDVSTGAFIAGGVFTALGTGLLLWSADNPKPPTASIPPLQLGILQASPTSFMLGAQGTIF